MMEQLGEQILVDLPGTVFIGVGQGGVARGFLHPEVDKLAFAGLESFVDFAETLRLSELAEKHRDELVPAAEAARMTLALASGDHPFKKRARYLLENLTENAGYS